MTPVSHDKLSQFFSGDKLGDLDSAWCIAPKKLSARTFNLEVLGGHKKYSSASKNRKCRCNEQEKSMKLNNWEVFGFEKCVDTTAVKSSATKVIKDVEKEMATIRKNSDRPNIMAKWKEMLESQPPSEDYECKHCLERTLAFETTDKQYYFDKEPVDNDDPNLEDIFFPQPKFTLSSTRRNAVAENQLCAHSLHRVQGQPTSKISTKRSKHLLDLLTTYGHINQEVVHPRAAARRVESLYESTVTPNRNLTNLEL